MGPELLLLHNELLVFAMMILLDPVWAGEGSKAVYIPHKCLEYNGLQLRKFFLH